MFSRILPLLALTAAALVAGCSSSPKVDFDLGPVVGQLLVEDFPGTAEIVEYRFTLYPTPVEVTYGSRLLPLTDAHVVDENSPDLDEVLDRFGFGLAFPRLPYEGFLLVVASIEGRTVVLQAARDDAGRAYAAGALAQISTDTADGTLARECRVVDYPAFRFRGNKRPQTWELAYRANFAWGASEGESHRGRELVAYVSPGSPLDTSERGVERILEEFEVWRARGVRHFAVKFDDVGFGLTPESDLAHGSYPRALARFMGDLQAALSRTDPEVELYLLPQTYWWNDPRMQPFALGIRAAGGLNRNIGLVMTGPEIISQEMSAAGLEFSRQVFGLTTTKALVYDNLGREGDWGPLTGRDPELRFVADGVFGERGTPVNRLTRLDWLWNPNAYDSERSWRRAVFELGGPDGFHTLLAACAAFRRGGPRSEAESAVLRFAGSDLAGWRTPVPKSSLVDQLRDDLGRLDATRTTAR